MSYGGLDTYEVVRILSALMRTACINSQRIYDARLAKDMSQADVAYKLRQHGHKATERSIRRWETGVNAPHANVVPALAEALGISIEKLYEQSDDDDEEDEAVLLRLAHVALDTDQPDMAMALIDRVRVMKARREVRS